MIYTAVGICQISFSKRFWWKQDYHLYSSSDDCYLFGSIHLVSRALLLVANYLQVYLILIASSIEAMVYQRSNYCMLLCIGRFSCNKWHKPILYKVHC